MTRRQFFAALIPSWLSRRNVLRASAILGIATCCSIAVSIFQRVGFVRTLKGVALGLGLLLALWLVSQVAMLVESAFRRAPRTIRKIWEIVAKAALIAIAVAQAVEIYRKWVNGEDLIGVWIAFGVTLFVYIADWQKRKRGEPSATDNPDDAQCLREDH